MNGEEKNNKATELNEKNLEEVSGGSRHIYIKKKCAVCGKLVFQCRASATGNVEDISESEYGRMKKFEDVF